MQPADTDPLGHLPVREVTSAAPTLIRPPDGETCCCLGTAGAFVCRACVTTRWLRVSVRAGNLGDPPDDMVSPSGPWRDNAAMAQRREIQLIDDVDGTAATQTVRFALDGRDLEIDLSEKNAAKLRKALDPYVGAGRRLGSQSGTSRRRMLAAGASGMSKEELANVRAWARTNGYEVANRGRIKGDIVEAYHAAH